MSKQLILDTLQHKATERAPWIPFAGIHAGTLTGVNATTLLTDADELYKALMEVNKLYKPDGQPIMFDLQIEAEILGCELVWFDDNLPSVKTHPLEETMNVPCKCTVPKSTDGRIPMVIDVMKRMKASVGDTTALYGLICGPFTLASHLRGNDLFMDMYDDEEYVEELLDYCKEVVNAVASYYIEAGMDVIAVVDPLVSQISASHFEEFLTKPYSEVFKFIKDNGAYSSFFVCGDATRNIEVMCQTNPDSISVDENVDLVAAKQITDQYNVVIGGNIPLTTVMLHGTQEDNMKYVVELLDKVENKKNLIISPGCDMPFNIPVENGIAVAQAVINTDSARKILESYVATSAFDIDVELPDYENLAKPLVEVFTLDSQQCAACTYMMGAANAVKDVFGDKIDMVEYKFTEKENIARCVKMGVKNLPAIYINGQLKFSSIIPSQEEFTKVIEEVL